jgi:hypothetical protein
MGGLGGLIITIIANPILYRHGILHRWHPGMRTVETVFANNFDFYLSLNRLRLAIGLIGIWHVIRSFSRREPVPAAACATCSGCRRAGETSTSGCRSASSFSTASYVLLCVWLVPTFGGFLHHLRVSYTPIISYITARMEGIAGQFRACRWCGGQLHRRREILRLSCIEIWYAPFPSTITARHGELRKPS